MVWWSKLFGGRESSRPPRPAVAVSSPAPAAEPQVLRLAERVGASTYSHRCAGEMHMLGAIQAVSGSFEQTAQRFDAEAILRPEPTTAHDPNAVAVFIRDKHVAYLPRDLAQVFVAQAADIAPAGT